MKRLVLLPIIGLSSIVFGQEIQVITGQDAFDKVNNAKTIRLKSFTEVPNYIEFIEGKEPSTSEIFDILNTTTKNNLSFDFINTTKDKLNMNHYRYKQTINGFPVEHSMIIVHTKNGKVVSVNGEALSSTPKNSSASISFNTALQIAKGHIGAARYKWEDPNEELFIKAEQNDPSATFFPKSELVYITKDGDLSKAIRLAYKLDIYAQEPLSRKELYIDANTGEILFSNDLIHTADVVGTAVTGYSGTQPITADSFGGAYRLRESGRGNGVETYDLNQNTSHGSAIDFTDNDNNWNNANAQLDQYAGDAHWGAEMTYDYFWSVHNRNSIDDAGFRLRSYIHYGTKFVNAFWDGSRMTYGDGDTIITSSNPFPTKPLTSMVIAGHEITHGLVSRTAGLVYSYQSGALNESFADIFGISIDFWSRPSQANWILGDEISNGSWVMRNMSNPNAKNHPDTYLGQHWYTGSGDNGGVHYNSGVQNFWYYLMVNGGTGTNDLSNSYSVTAQGFNIAEKIAFRNLTVYLTSSSQYVDARFYAIKAATDLYGGCSPEVEATTDAWYAVGVGSAYNPNVTADFAANKTVGCAAPFTVTFNNLSNNAITYSWDFGDGNTSTAANPTHTYTATGLYTVKLVADGGSCGIDSITKVGYIDVDPSNPCPLILPVNGNITDTNCAGTLYDDGGPSGIYSANQDSYITIAPTGAAQVNLTINSFDVEGFTNCGYDYVEIFDGPSTSSPLIGKYCNTNNPPPSIINSTGGAITIHFHTDPGLHLQGFSISWNCVTGGSPLPTAQFTGTPTTICVGDNVTFNNSSINATSYSWTFTGGTPATSTATNPSVTYNTPGTYPVKLVATNGSGSDSLTRTAYIQVDTTCPIILPPNTTHPTQTKCTGTVYDDGGPSGNYTPNQDSYITIAPTGATSVTLNMAFFDIEPGSGGAVACDYDYLEIFDGPTTSSPSLGKFCNTSTPPPTITSTGGAVTIHFHTDPGLHLQGFQIDWQCNTGSPTPVANFSSSTTLVCAGSSVNFYDQSTGSPTSWNWTFNGGTPASSTTQNPVVTYSSPGTYDVVLQVSNASGSDTKTSTGHITVFDNLTAAFTQTAAGLNVLFTDNSSGATQWDWDFGDGNTSTSQNNNHVYATAGTYTVCLIVDNPACDTVSTCQTITVNSSIGVDENELLSDLKIFPNPTNGLLNIQVEFNKEENLSLRLVDILGNLITDRSFDQQSKNYQETLDMTNLAKGSYVLYINNLPYKITRE